MARKTASVAIRPLTADDLPAVIDIDTANVGRKRLGFFERRLEAALNNPKNFIYVGAEQDGALKGFALVRLVAGEFGEDEMVAVLDTLGVEAGLQGEGVGHAMMAEIDTLARAKNITEMRTQSIWTSHSLLRFLDSMGFETAPRLILSRKVEGAMDWG